jgi:hypothetical protein
MNVTKDPLYERLFDRSFADDDWRGRLLIGILENALHDFLGYRSPKLLVDQAAHFIYDDNVMFELCMDVLGMDKDIFRERIAEMKMRSERLRRTSEGSGGNRVKS